MSNNIVWLQTKTLIIGAVAFISALAWNSAFQNLFNHVPYLNKGGPWIYAILQRKEDKEDSECKERIDQKNSTPY